jgi:hypothetical protein
MCEAWLSVVEEEGRGERLGCSVAGFISWNAADTGTARRSTETECSVELVEVYSACMAS